MAKAGKNSCPKEGFALNEIHTSSTPACRYCHGTLQLSVETSDYGLVGYVVSSHPDGIGPDPDTHPATPHYRPLWHSEDALGNIVDANTENQRTPYELGSALTLRARSAGAALANS